MILRSRRGRRPGLLLAVAAALAAIALAATPAPAHEIPVSVVVRAFVKPEGQRLRLLVRVPLEAIRDINFPLRGPGYLDVSRAGSHLAEAARLWIAGYVQLFEDEMPLEEARVVAARASLPADRSFASYTAASAHMAAAPIDASVDLPWQQALLDVELEYRIRSDQSRFSIRPEWAQLGQRTTTVLRFELPNGVERALEFKGNPGLVRLDPRWHQAALRFIALGFDHILGGFDHLLFLLCLVIPFRRVRSLLVVVTAFTVAHSITLIASALGLAPAALWFPPLIETLIALSIVYMAIENIVGPRLERRWMVAFAFGLVHGFGFSFALRESLQFAGSHLLTSLLFFNAGVEMGQIAVLGVCVPALALLFRYAVNERTGTVVLSAIVAHSAWHWMTERGGVLREYRVQWPALDLAFAVAVMRAALLALVAAGAAWLLHAALANARPRRRIKRLSEVAPSDQ